MPETQANLWYIRLFGPIEAIPLQTGLPSIVRFRTRRSAALLAYLALRPGQWVRREVLVDILWPESELSGARDRLKQELSSLRRQLEPSGLVTRGTVLETSGNDIVRLRPGAVRTDTQDFEEAVRRLDALRRRGDIPNSQDWAKRALELYGAEGLLPGVYDEWAGLERERLAASYEAVRIQQETLAHSGEAADKPRPAHQEAGARHLPTSLHSKLKHLPLPPPNRFWGRDGDVDSLLTLLMRDPVTRLITLTGPGGSGKTRLALETAWLLREKSQARAGCRVLGFVPLAHITEPDRLPLAVLAALYPEPVEVAQDVIRQLTALLRQEATHPDGRRILLILDNYEQLAETGAQFVTELLKAVPGLMLLITSRQALRLEGERTVEVPPLALPDSSMDNLEEIIAVPSVALFADRARSARPDFQVNARNVVAVMQLCTALDGLPLALEIAAARVSGISPGRMCVELAQGRLNLLLSRRRDAEARHQSLRATVAWSVDLLPEPTHQAFARFSVFRGGFDLDAARAVSGPDALEHIETLLHHSLLQADMSGSDGEMRFRLLETVRDYSSELLTDTGREESAYRHAQYFVALSEAHSDHKQMDRTSAECIDRERGNIHAALEWCLHTRTYAEDRAGQFADEIALRFTYALLPFWELYGRHREFLPWVRKFYGDTPAPVSDTQTARELLLWARAYMAVAMAYLEGQGFLTTNPAFLRTAVSLCRRVGDQAVLGEVLVQQMRMEADVHTRAAINEEVLALGQQTRNEGLIAKALTYRAGTMMLTQRYAEGDAMHQEALEIYLRGGRQQEAAVVLNEMGFFAMQRNEFDRAQACLKRSEELCRAVDFVFLCHVQWVHGHLCHRRGEYGEAESLYNESLARRRRHHTNEEGIAITLNALGGLMTSLCRFDEGRQFFRQSLEMPQRVDADINARVALGHLEMYAGFPAAAKLLYMPALRECSVPEPSYPFAPHLLGAVLWGLGHVAIQEGDFTRADQHLQASLRQREKLQDRRGLIQVIEAIALSIAVNPAAQGRTAEAIHLLHIAEIERARLRTPRTPAEEQKLSPTHDLLRNGSAQSDPRNHSNTGEAELDKAVRLLLEHP